MRENPKYGEFKEAVALAVDVLRRNPLRSFLTVLGIVIGVTTIIVIGAVINGLNSNVLGNISQLGSSTIIVSKFSWATLGRPSFALLQRKELKAEWVDGLPLLPHVMAVSPVRSRLRTTKWVRDRAKCGAAIFARRASSWKGMGLPSRESAISI